MCRLMRGYAVALVLILPAAGAAKAADLTLKRVMLSSGGVGYLEYEAAVEGDATLTLDVALDQVDDVLKSLVVYDDGGRAGETPCPAASRWPRALPICPSTNRRSPRRRPSSMRCKGRISASPATSR